MLKRDVLTITVTSGTPGSRAEGSWWAGASGAPVFYGELLVGVLGIDPALWTTGRLTAFPVAAFADDPGFSL